MSDKVCTVCPYLRMQLSFAVGALSSTAQVIEDELNQPQPTQPRIQFMRGVQFRLKDAAENSWRA